VDAEVKETMLTGAYGEGVWSWRRGAGAKLAGGVPPMTEAKQPFSGEITL
jgi:hypothetical protein